VVSQKYKTVSLTLKAMAVTSDRAKATGRWNLRRLLSSRLITGLASCMTITWRPHRRAGRELKVAQKETHEVQLLILIFRCFDRTMF